MLKTINHTSSLMTKIARNYSRNKVKSSHRLLVSRLCLRTWALIRWCTWTVNTIVSKLRLEASHALQCRGYSSDDLDVAELRLEVRPEHGRVMVRLDSITDISLNA